MLETEDHQFQRIDWSAQDVYLQDIKSTTGSIVIALRLPLIRLHLCQPLNLLTLYPAQLPSLIDACNACFSGSGTDANNFPRENW